MAYEPPFTLTSEMLNLCSEISEMVGMLDTSSDLQKNPVLHRKLRIKTIHSSLAIEQNTLSEEQVTAVIDGKRVLGPESEILEVENAAKAYELLPTLDPANVEDLLRAHKAMMAGLRPDAGTFRSGNVGVFDGTKLIHAGTPAAYVPMVVADLFEWLARTDLHPLLSSCIFHYEFEFIHPFSDGNGRTGRLWHTLILSHWRSVLAWLPIESIIRKRQSDYYANLNDANSSGESTAFVLFMLKVIREALKPFTTQNKQYEETQRILSALAENPTITVSQLADQLALPKRTTERRLAKLKEEGRLTRVGGPRNGVWHVR